MSNKIKRALGIAGIVIAVIAIILTVIVIIDKITLNNIPKKSVNNMTPTEIAYSMSQTNDNDRLLELGDELFNKRDKIEIEKELTSDNLIACQSIYSLAIISNGDFEKYLNQTILFTNSIINTDVEKYFLTLFDQFYKMTASDTQKQMDICKMLIENPVEFKNIYSKIYYITFLYYLSASMKLEDTKIFDEELKKVLESSNVDYNDFFEQERLLYCISTFNAKNYTVFENIFLESNNDDHEPSAMLISYLVNSELDDDSKSILIKCLENLIEQTDISNISKINGLNEFLKILREEGHTGYGSAC